MKKAPANASNGSEIENRGTRNHKGSKVFVKRVKKRREPRKTQVTGENIETKSTTSSLFEDIRKQLVFKSSG